jgi:hypothetical protein
VPAAASQLGLRWQLQQQGGSDRAELSSASSLSLQLPSCMRSLIGKLLKLSDKLMINAYTMCVCVSGLELELGHSQLSGPAPEHFPPLCAPAATAAAHLGGARRISSSASSLNLSYFFVRVPLQSLMGLPCPRREEKMCLPQHRSWGCSGSCNSKGVQIKPS